MKKIVSTLVIILFSLSVFSQNNKEKLPIFENCKAKPEEDACFFTTIQDHFKQNFNKEYTAEKSTIIALFAVDTLGKFNLLYIDAASEEIKSETQRVFSLLPTVEPATYNGNAIYAKYTLKVNFPFSDDERSKKKAENAYHTEKITAQTEIKEFEDIVYQKFQNPQFKSGLNIPFNHQKYTEFEAYLNQVGTNNHTAEKPYSYKDVARYYDFEKNYAAKLKKASSWLGRKFWNENLVAIQGDGYWFLFNPILDVRGGKDFSSQLKNTFVNTRGVNIQAGIGNNITLTTSIYESQGRFADYYNAYAISLKPSGGNPATIPGVGIAKQFRVDAFDFPMAEANIKFTASRFFDVQLGYGRNFIGDGYRSIIQGDATSPYPFIKFNTTFWKVKYTNTYMFLRDITPENTAENTYASKYMANHYLSWNVSKRWNLGMFESVVWSNTNGRGFDPNFINPIIFYRAVEFASSPKSGNALLGLTSKYKFNSLISAYSQLLIDEFSVGDVSKGNKSWKNKFGYQIGAKYFNAFHIENLTLQVEYNIVRPYVYSHSVTLTNYTHNNQSMGHPWGANFKELIGIARYNKNRYFAQAKVIYGKKGYDYTDGTNNYNYGGNLFIPYDSETNPRPYDEGAFAGQGNTTTILIGDFTAGYMINPSSNLKIFANVIYRSFNPTKTSVTFDKTNTTWVSIGISTDLFNWYFDY